MDYRLELMLITTVHLFEDQLRFTLVKLREFGTGLNTLKELLILKVFILCAFDCQNLHFYQVVKKTPGQTNLL